MNRRTLAVSAAVLSGAILFSACGGDDDQGADADTTAAAAAPTEPAASETTPVDAEAVVAASAFNDADVEFAQGMIGHHEQAIEMADMALDPTVESSAEVQDLATRIKAAQDPEIELMTGWLTAWGQPVTMDAADHDMSSMDGMMSVEDMDALGQATGADFDTMWLEMMIQHHEGAISMAEDEQTTGMNDEAVALTDTIITAQQGEIEEMQDLLEA